MLPWKNREFAGFPTANHVIASCVSQVVEDLPQLVIQVMSASANGWASTVTNASIALTVFSLLTKGLKKVRPPARQRGRSAPALTLCTLQNTPSQF